MGVKICASFPAIINPWFQKLYPKMYKQHFTTDHLSHLGQGRGSWCTGQEECGLTLRQAGVLELVTEVSFLHRWDIVTWKETQRTSNVCVHVELQLSFKILERIFVCIAWADNICRKEASFTVRAVRLKRWLLQDIAVVWSKAVVMKIVLLLIRAVTIGNHSCLL